MQAGLVSASDKYYFLVRRLHSLSGLVPVGIFLCLHLTTNASILAPGKPGAVFQESVERIHALGPLLVPVEIIGIFIPLAFHALLGFAIIFTGKTNAREYRYGGNVRFVLQRATAMIAFLFIMYHLWQMHWLGKPLGGGQFELHDAAGQATGALTTARAVQSSVWVWAIYFVGITSTVFHLANGVWTSLITWGITIKPRSQQIAGYVCAVFGVVLTLVGLGALRGFSTFDVAGQTGLDSGAHVTDSGLGADADALGGIEESPSPNAGG